MMSETTHQSAKPVSRFTYRSVPLPHLRGKEPRPRTPAFAAFCPKWIGAAFGGVPLTTLVAVHGYFSSYHATVQGGNMVLSSVVIAGLTGVFCLWKARPAWWILVLYATLYLPALFIGGVLLEGFHEHGHWLCSGGE